MPETCLTVLPSLRCSRSPCFTGIPSSAFVGCLGYFSSKILWRFMAQQVLACIWSKFSVLSWLFSLEKESWNICYVPCIRGSAWDINSFILSSEKCWPSGVFFFPVLFVYFWEHASVIDLLRAPFMNKSYHRELCLEKRHTRRFSVAGLKAYKETGWKWQCPLKAEIWVLRLKCPHVVPLLYAQKSSGDSTEDKSAIPIATQPETETRILLDTELVLS